ncbi:PREDICTED: mitochondrial enolase superfamily member 1-like [Vollenhovia emeryi]|uniref:mitochondrial enolase superfamily member 1-like n=1 Tax=Vollenhovia emeryi TaxID=411798 RepID=UPI0005F4413A|nr:PREDICTED: mitochondrial enolase superfamily member 1-like [Vollenhovia emeryi]
MVNAKIVDIQVHDVRFPTSMWRAGADSLHPNPNHSCTYVILCTDKGHKGYGIAATLGRGNEFVVQTCTLMFEHVKNRTTTEIFSNFASFWRRLTTDAELRWLGPECGVVHLATAAIVNALWDLWARIEGKPVWQLLTDMTPEQLVSTVDFRYIRDVVTEEEAMEMLRNEQPRKEEKKKKLQSDGYPAYTADIVSSAFSSRQVKSACKKFKKLDFNDYKAPVGRTIAKTARTCKLIRSVLGGKKTLLVDANQCWDQTEVIAVMKYVNEKRHTCTAIEEPTCCDDTLGYVQIRDHLEKSRYPVQVSCGQTCANRVVFKQFLKIGGIDFWNINVGRLGGVNEALAVYFMAKKHRIPVWGHTGGVGLGEMIQHLQMWNAICLSSSDIDKIEYTSHQHGYFEDPVFVRNASFLLPNRPGFSTKLKDKCIVRWSYPEGTRWKHLYKIKRFKNELRYQDK